MIYRVYVRDMGEISLIVETTSCMKACAAYSDCFLGCGMPRIAVDGRELKIFEAEKLVSRTLQRRHKKLLTRWAKARSKNDGSKEDGDAL